MLIKKIIILITVSSVSLSTAAQKYTVTGTVWQTFPYCGGANPGKDVLKNMNKEKPFENKTFYVRKGEKNNCKNKIVATCKTDSAGNFFLKLPKGTYSMIVAEQVNEINVKDYNDNTQTADSSCLENWWREPYYLLTVKDKNIKLEFTFRHRCYLNNDIPCVTYKGALHP